MSYLLWSRKKNRNFQSLFHFWWISFPGINEERWFNGNPGNSTIAFNSWRAIHAKYWKSMAKPQLSDFCSRSLCSTQTLNWTFLLNLFWFPLKHENYEIVSPSTCLVQIKKHHLTSKLKRINLEPNIIL